eukprot:6117314-Pyramimonas_sp.AAC.1
MNATCAQTGSQQPLSNTVLQSEGGAELDSAFVEFGPVASSAIRNECDKPPSVPRGPSRRRLPPPLLTTRPIRTRQVAAMQAVLACVWPHFLWSSVYGAAHPDPAREDGSDDALATLLAVLRRRLRIGTEVAAADWTDGAADGTGYPNQP